MAAERGKELSVATADSRLSAELDPGVAAYVEALNGAGIETFESCEGGAGHAVTDPTVWLYGDRSQGFRALAVCIEHRLPVYELRRTWTIQDGGDPTGPIWELAFSRKASKAPDEGRDV